MYQGGPISTLASPPDGASIAREICCCVIHSLRRLLSKFQPNQMRCFVLTAGMSTDFREMRKEQYRSVIRFLFFEEKLRSKIKERLDTVYGNSSPSMATVKNWFNKFQHGRTSVFVSHVQVPQKWLPRRKMWKKIHNLVFADHRLKMCKIAETVAISKDHEGHILHEILSMRKLSARWVLRLLTPDNKRNRETTSEQCFDAF